MNNPFDLQSTLQDDLVKLVPLKPEDFEELYKVASDPLIWEQHPESNRYQKEIFKKYFDEAINSNGAFLITDLNDEVIGSSRYYEVDIENSSVAIGYSFIGRSWWGGKYNGAIKNLMLQYAFQYVNTVFFHIGSTNFRSQKALEKLNGKRCGETSINNKPYLIYKIDK